MVAVSDDLAIDAELVIPADELEWRFTTAGGPGGQHANRSATRAELSWDLAASRVVGPQLRERLRARLASHLQDGRVVVAAGESRSQWRNRQVARRRLADLIRGARLEPKRRLPTALPPAARRRRREAKQRRSDLKRLRRPPEFD